LDRGINPRYKNTLLPPASCLLPPAFVNTADKNLPYQQNLVRRMIRVVILDTQTTRPDYLVPLMEKISELILSLPVGSSIFINDLGEIRSVYQ
jgi:hypothetical protein